MRSDVIGAKRTAYAITVTDENGVTVWDTHWVNCDCSVGIRYAGQALAAAMQYTVAVKIKNQTGQETAGADIYLVFFTEFNPGTILKQLWMVLAPGCVVYVNSNMFRRIFERHITKEPEEAETSEV